MSEAFTGDILINAPRPAVWRALTAAESMSQWAAEFGGEASFAGDWKEGGEIRCWDKNGDGLISAVLRCEPESYAEIEHVAGLARGERCELSGEHAEWKGLHEKYSLSDEGRGGPVKLSVCSETPPSLRDLFFDKWPSVLQKIKTLSESA